MCPRWLRLCYLSSRCSLGCVDEGREQAYERKGLSLASSPATAAIEALAVYIVKIVSAASLQGTAASRSLTLSLRMMESTRGTRFSLGLVVVAVLQCRYFIVCADEWLTYRHDQHRSGVSSEELSTGPLTQVWQWQSPLPPVWHGPMPRYGTPTRSLKACGRCGLRFGVSTGGLPKANYCSPVTPTTACAVRLGSWCPPRSLTTGGPIRVAPTIANGKAYFGSDDGCVYAVEVEDGSLLWKRQLVEADCFVNDGRLCSFQPVRTGVLLDESTSTLVVGAGIFPWRPSLLCALQADSGELAWKQDLGLGYTIEGPLLLGAEHIVSPQGRAPPQLFARADGKPVGCTGWRWGVVRAVDRTKRSTSWSWQQGGLAHRLPLGFENILRVSRRDFDGGPSRGSLSTRSERGHGH